MEYHLSEIFIPEELLGRPRNIIRDPLGKILYVEYEEDSEPQLKEQFTCDQCERDFTIELTISAKAKPVEEEKDFSEEYVSLI